MYLHTHAIMLYNTINVSHIVKFVPKITMNTTLIQVNSHHQSNTALSYNYICTDATI